MFKTPSFCILHLVFRWVVLLLTDCTLPVLGPGVTCLVSYYSLLYLKVHAVLWESVNNKTDYIFFIKNGNHTIVYLIWLISLFWILILEKKNLWKSGGLSILIIFFFNLIIKDLLHKRSKQSTISKFRSGSGSAGISISSWASRSVCCVSSVCPGIE